MIKKGKKKAVRAVEPEAAPAQGPIHHGEPPEPETAPAPIQHDTAPKFNTSDLREGPQRSHADKIRESREVLKHPVPPGMVIFEAPDGFCILSEASHSHMKYRDESGKDMWINPRR